MINNIINDINSLIGTGNVSFNKKILQIIPGGYGKKDVLLGVSLPNLRKIAKKYYLEVEVFDIEYFLQSEIHEYRLLAVILISMLYEQDATKMFNLYINNFFYLNNWDIIDISCYKIVGRYLYDKFNDDEIFTYLKNLYEIDNFWVRRIAIVSTNYLIKKNKISLTLKFLELTVGDKHHLNNKALGWMLREVGKKDKERLIVFLKNNKVANVTFNYATEKFTKEEKIILKGLN